MSKLWLIGGAVLVGGLLLASVVVTLTQSDEPFPEGTPERVVERFLEAYQEEDFETAYSLLSDTLKENCPIDEFATGNLGDPKGLRGSRVTHEGTIYLDDTAIVVARVTTIRGSGPFGTSESSHEQRLTLVRHEGGEWRLKQSKWPFYGCFNPRIERDAPALTSTPTPTVSPSPGPTTTPALSPE